MTVSNNAIVRANGGISDNSSADIQIGDGDDSSGGIVFNGNAGTVYGSVTLEENLTVGNGESLHIPEGASLTIPAGTNLTNEGTINNSGTLSGDIQGIAPPSITTTSPLASGTVGTAYSANLTTNSTTTAASWSITAGSLPPGLSLDAGSGTIAGTPTTAGTYNFTVNSYERRRL